MSHLKSFLPTLGLVALMSSGTVHAQVTWTVDESAVGAGALTTVQAAVDAAQENDLILILPGYYPGFSIEGKSLSLSALPPLGGKLDPQKVVIEDSIQIESIGVGQRILIEGLTVVVTDSAVDSCEGQVRFQNCSFGTGFHLIGGSALIISQSSAVSLVDCTIDNRTAPSLGFEATALEVNYSSIFLFGTSIYAGHGTIGSALFGDAGGHGPAGLLLQSSFALATGCIIQGGEGGEGGYVGDDGFPLFPLVAANCTHGGDGGPAVELWQITSADPPAQLISLDTIIKGGDPGAAALQCRSGFPGPALLDQGGSLTELGVSARRLNSVSPVQVGEQIALGLEGQAGDLYVLALSFFDAVPVFSALINGASFLPTQQVKLVVGLLDENGVSGLNIPLNDFGIPFATLHAQSFMIGSDAQVIASNPSFTQLLGL